MPNQKQKNPPLKRILGITAHPDDNIMFAGTVFKYQKLGYEYFEIVLTDGGEGANYKNASALDYARIKEKRSREMKKAARYLNIKKVFAFNEEDQGLYYNKELMHRLMKVVREIKPEIVFCMNTDDVHPDHIAASELGREACRWAAKNFRPELGAPHRPEKVYFCEGTIPVKNISVLVDVSDYMKKKETLFKKYLSQSAPNEIALMKSLALMRGHLLRQPGRHYAEAFSAETTILPILF